jgi:hypothetical protein
MFKYSAMAICSYQNWPDNVHYALRRAWKAALLMMRMIIQGRNNTNRLVYTSLAGPILEWGGGTVKRLKSVAEQSR